MLAEKSAWNAWEGEDGPGSICCGDAGRAYAVLDFYRHSGDAIWIDRARRLCVRAFQAAAVTQPYLPNSLYKGELGIAVLASDLERPERARQPFFALERRV